MYSKSSHSANYCSRKKTHYSKITLLVPQYHLQKNQMQKHYYVDFTMQGRTVHLEILFIFSLFLFYFTPPSEKMPKSHPIIKHILFFLYVFHLVSKDLWLLKIRLLLLYKLQCKMIYTITFCLTFL